ncbi:MAG TPA: enoyl-CoA hydratase [Kineosporiaceae bacterium]|nr:enoyl-CoA hydratase [Kineosporiaceae bacterium]
MNAIGTPGATPGAGAATDATRPLVRREAASGVVRLTLARGERYNPLSRSMIAALRAELDTAAADPAARVVVLAAEGRGFCAGHDLAEMRAHTDDAAWQTALFDECNELMTTLTRLPQPVVARVHGIATAAGCQLVSMCDLAVAAETAHFALPGVNIGVFCSTPAVGVARSVGRKRAMELLLTGAPVEASTALAWGLVNRVVPLDRLDAEVDKLCRAIVAHSGPVIANGKRTFYAQLDQPLDAAYAVAADAMVRDLSAPDAAEGIDAFLGKRDARWPSSGDAAWSPG